MDKKWCFFDSSLKTICVSTHYNSDSLPRLWSPDKQCQSPWGAYSYPHIHGPHPRLAEWGSTEQGEGQPLWANKTSRSVYAAGTPAQGTGFKPDRTLLEALV